MKLFRLLLIASLFIGSAAKADLNYQYFEGGWNNLPDLSSLKALKSGTSATLDLSVRSREIYYAIQWTGFITIPADGNYTFESISDDGSMVYLGTGLPLVVNNDGQHAVLSRTGSAYLAAGTYPVKIVYMNACCDGTLQLYWTGPGTSRQPVPASAFSATNTPVVSNTASGLDYQYFEGGWNNLPDFSGMTALKSGTSANLDLSVRSREIYYAIRWTGFITIPAAGNYTFESISDDGSMVYLGNNLPLVVNNDGQHGVQSRSGSAYLAAGTYPVKIVYMNACCDGTLQLYWTGPGISRQPVPSDAYSRTAAAVVTPVAPVTVTPDPVVETPLIVADNSTETGGLTGSTNYYFSSATGDDSRSAAQAQNPATPWKSLAKLNAVMPTAQPGTAFLLKRGESFDGSITVAASGASGAPIVLSAYGTGAKPVISGFASSASWSALGNGVWEAPLSTSFSRMNMVARGGQIQGMGRWPNITDANRGYMTFESHNGTQTIVDNQLPASPNWTGAELAIRKNRWTIDRGTVIYHSGNVIAQTDPSGMEPIDGFGYFIQNDPRTLDQLGEWYFNPATRRVQLFTGNAGNPASLGFKPSVVDTLVVIRSRNWITLDNVSLQGANSYAVAAYDQAGNVTIQNCSIDFSGVNAITANYTRNLQLLGSTINHTNNNSLYLAPYCLNTTIKNNTIRNTGLIPGMGSSNNQAYEGMTIDGAGSVIQFNTVDSTGYIAIAFTRESVTVENNFVNNFALTTDDGAGIYTHDAGYKGRRIVGNVVLNGKGSKEGTDTPWDCSAQGIGTDDMSTDVEISGNTIANCSGKGIGLHNSQSITLKGNTIFNNKGAQIEFDHDNIAAQSPTRNISMTDNILFAKQAGQPVFTIVTKDDDAAQFGTADNNYYCRPIDDGLVFHTHSMWNSGSDKEQDYDLSHWRGFAGQDLNSKKSPLSIPSYTVTSTGANMISNGTFDNNLNGILNPGGGYSTLSMDRASLDGGALKIAFTGNGSASGMPLNVWFYDAASVRTLQAGHSYRVKFSIRGLQDNNTDFQAAIRSASSNTSSDTKIYKVYNTRQEIELIFVPASDIASAYLSVFTMNAGLCNGFVIDNVRMEEVTLSYTNVDDYVRFEYNASATAKTVSLDGTYVDMKGQSYNGTITIAGYSSAVLLKKSGLATAQDQTQGATAASAKAAELVSEPVLPASVKISPNPATSQIRFTHGLGIKGQEAGVVTLYNAAGTVVKQSQVSVSTPALTIQVAELKAGVYTVKLDCGLKTVSSRFVKL